MNFLILSFREFHNHVLNANGPVLLKRRGPVAGEVNKYYFPLAANDLSTHFIQGIDTHPAIFLEWDLPLA
jgi:hypothetical protein